MNSGDRWTLDLTSVVIGFLVAVYLGWIVQRIRKERVTMQKTDKYMTVETKQTPRQLFILADAAFWRYLGYWILFIVSAFIVGYIVYVLYVRPN
jgi:hypothetical protein